VGNIGRMSGMRNAYKILIIQPERKQSLGRPSMGRTVILVVKKQGVRIWTGLI
jgi:hypothetical protein